MSANYKRSLLIFLAISSLITIIIFPFKGFSEAKSFDIFIIFSKMTWNNQIASLERQCPSIENERQLPELRGNSVENALNWSCYIALDNEYLQTGAGFGTLVNWVSKNKSQYSVLVENLKAWTPDNNRNLKESLSKLGSGKIALLIKYFHQLVIARYVKDSGPINGLLWSKDRWAEADRQSKMVTTTDNYISLRSWSLKALEDAVANQKRQSTATYRGKVMRSDNMDEFLLMFKKGAYVWEPAFISTTKSREIALGYTDMRHEVNVLFKIARSRSGGDLEIRQQEITFPPNTMFRVINEPIVLKNHQESFEGNGFVENNCKAQQKCTGKWKYLIVVELTESSGGRKILQESEKEVEAICGKDHFLQQCGRHEFLKKTRGYKAKMKRKFAGTRIGDCSFKGKKYKCRINSKGDQCVACVLCLKSDGSVRTKISKLNKISCKGRRVSKDGFYFSAEDDGY